MFKYYDWLKNEVAKEPKHHSPVDKVVNDVITDTYKKESTTNESNISIPVVAIMFFIVTYYVIDFSDNVNNQSVKASQVTQEKTKQKRMPRATQKKEASIEEMQEEKTLPFSLNKQIEIPLKRTFDSSPKKTEQCESQWITENLQEGSINAIEVSKLQLRLNKLVNANMRVDGVYGSQTKRHLRTLQVFVKNNSDFYKDKEIRYGVLDENLREFINYTYCFERE